MAEQLDKTDLSWSFFDAHTSKIDDMPVHEDKFRRLNGRRLNKAEIGCYASHLHLIREHAINPRSEIMIVLEDDAIIDTDYFKNSENFLRIVERFGYVRLNAQMAAPSSEVFIEGRRRLVRFRKKVHGTLGYAVTREAARKFASHLVEMRRPVDIEMDRFWDHGIPILCLYQPVAIESSKSTQLDIRAFDITGLD